MNIEKTLTELQNIIDKNSTEAVFDNGVTELRIDGEMYDNIMREFREILERGCQNG